MFLVVGTCGEYDDRQKWPVAIFATKKLAIRYTKLCLARYRVIYKRQADRLAFYRDIYNPKYKNKYDPLGQIDNNNEYEVYELPYYSDLPALK